MTLIIEKPTIIKAAGNKPKQIEEFFGRVNSSTDEISIARMVSPEGWAEPGQTPEFNEYTLILSGKLKVKTRTEIFVLEAGQALVINKGDWVQYSTPFAGGAEYVAICLPAFSPEMVHRDEY
ncbi:MAG: hypothetical protein JXB49_10395 [Bacteroidales bacterium]|nr:hypothetical protein [Bacteroidales bacterium]